MKKPCYEFFLNKKQNTLDIVLHDEIGFWGTQSKDFLNTLNENKNVSVINVDINSPGGEVFDGFSIYNNLVKHPAKVNVYISGLAASIASVIAMAGDNIEMPDTSMIFIHRVSTGARGDAQELKDTATALEKLENGVIAAYKTRMSLSKAKIKEMMVRKTWIEAEEAKEFGLVDSVVEVEDEKEENRFDFTPYNYGEIPDEVLNRFDVSRKPVPSLIKKVNKFFNKNKPPKVEGDEDMDNKEFEKKLNDISAELAESKKLTDSLVVKIDAQHAEIVTQNEVIKNLKESTVQSEINTRENEYRNFLTSNEMKGRIKPVEVENHVKNMVEFYDLDAKNFTAEKTDTPKLDNYKNTLKSFPVIFSGEEHFANNNNASNLGGDSEKDLENKITEIMKRDKVARGQAHRLAILENPHLNTWIGKK